MPFLWYNYTIEKAFCTRKEEIQLMYRVLNIQVDKCDFVYTYLDKVAHLTNNLSNAVLFRERQMITSAKKDVKEWTDNEKEIRDEVETTIQYLGNTLSLVSYPITSWRSC